MTLYIWYIWNNAVTDHDPGPDDTVVSDDDSTDVSDAGDVMEETENTDIEHNENEQEKTLSNQFVGDHFSRDC